MRPTRLALLAVAVSACGVVLGAPQPSYALDESGVLVLVNSASPEGLQVASYYARAYPGVRTLALDNVPVTEEVSWDVYLNSIRPQVLSALTGSTDCIVTTKGLPLRIDNPKLSPAGWNQYSSLESELARIDSISSRLAMSNQGILNPLALNPYYGEDQRFAHAAYGTRLVTRLDGFTVADVIASIDRSQQAVIGRTGYCFVLDDHPGLTDLIEDLRDDVLVPAGQDYIYDATDAFIREAPGPVFGYVSHGVHGGVQERYVRDPGYGLAFVIAPGAVFHTWESFNAYTFEGDNSTCSPKRQGLVAQWIARGGTAGVGHVEEPGASALTVTNEDILFEKLLAGYTWAEAAWNATPQVSFVNTVVGNPLMVLREWAAGDYDLDGDVDPSDLAALSLAYGARAGEPDYDLWADFDNDRDVDSADLAKLGLNWAPGGYGGTSGAPVPEPAAIALLVAGAMGVIRRASRRSACAQDDLP